MNKLNERTMQPNDLVVISSKRIEGAEPVEYWPGLFMIPTRIVVELTNAGRLFLQEIHEKFFSESIDETYTIQKIREVAEYFSGYVSEVEDKLWYELLKLNDKSLAQIR